jgi:hypothetical protein
MLLLFIIFAALLTAAAIGVSINQKRRPILSSETSKKFEPPTNRGLFAPTEEEMRLFEQEEKEKLLAERRAVVHQNWRGRASDGDFTVLTEAKESGDSQFFEELLDLLTEKNKLEPENFFGLVSFISDKQFPVSETFARAVLTEYLEKPQTNFLPKVLHISALTGSAENYLQTIESVFNLWKQKKLEKISADQLVTLFESHYRLLPGNQTASGTGFLLKEKLGNIRREVLGK